MGHIIHSIVCMEGVGIMEVDALLIICITYVLGWIMGFLFGRGKRE